MARGGDGRDLDAFSQLKRSLPIDIVYPYIPLILYVRTYNPHNVSQISNSKRGSKTRKIQIQERIKILGIDKIYTYIISMGLGIKENGCNRV